MHITAYCPSCRTRYQLDAAMRGQRIICPNQVCREIFEVQEAEPKPSAPNEPPPANLESAPSAGGAKHDLGETPVGTLTTAGSVGDFVPILDAEVVHEEPPPTPIEVDDSKPIPVDPSLLPPPIEVENLVPLEPDEEKRAEPPQEAAWHMPPPIRNPEVAPPRAEESEAPAQVWERADTRKPKKASRSRSNVPARLPEEAPPSWQSPPPIRRGPGQPLTEPASLPPTPASEGISPAFSAEPAYQTAPASTSTSRRPLWLIGAMVLVAGFIIAAVTVVTLDKYAKTEEKVRVQAKTEYDAGKYATAAATYQSLIKDFPNSDSRSFYQMMAELSHLRDQVQTAQADPSDVATAADRFLADYNSNPFLKSYGPDLRLTLGKLAEQVAGRARQEHQPALLARAKEIRERSRRFPLPSGGSDPDESGKLIATVEAEITHWQKKQELLARLREWMRDPSVQAVKEARQLARQQGLDQDPEIKNGIAQLDTAVRLTVRYVATDPSAVPVDDPTAGEIAEPGLLMVPEISRPAKPASSGRRAVFALARGVLYALDQNTGAPLWAIRVGIDTANLPQRLPATPPYPELLLVLSADRNTIMALEPLTGRPAWQHRLSAPCLGRPLVVGRKAFIPTYDGRVYEIETALGYVLGHFEIVGQQLSVGGVHQEGTNLLFFPGDSDYVYVLDAALGSRAKQKKECVAILHTGHPSGSLRSEPILVNRTDPFARTENLANAAPSYLILTQTDGLTNMKLRVFQLPIENPDAAPQQEERHIRGWSWFRPYHDPERIAFATDAGVLGLFGINQLRNLDTPLFPELPLSAEQKQKPAASETLIRGQVVHVVENDFWVLAGGKLERLHFDPFRRQQMVPVWETPLVLGSPVHASQADENDKTLFVVTQDLSRQVYLATAVSAEDGTIKWQRQLGLESQGEPLVLGNEIVLADRGGGLCILDSSKHPDVQDRELRDAELLYAPASGQGPMRAYVLPSPDGTCVYEVASSTSASGGTLTLRRHLPSDTPAALEKATLELKLAAAPGGTPAIVGQSLLVPLADGATRRFSLTDGRGEGGPDWRAARVDEDARGHIVALGPDEFLTTDGSRGLTHWRWPANERTFQTVPENRTPTVEMPARIVSAPVVLPSAKGDGQWQVCVADAEGNLSLLGGPDLKREQPWPRLEGKITAGPFRRGQYLGCVIDRRRLVWIDPAKEGLLWEYKSPGEAIVGEPQMVDGVVLVADLAGRFIGLDPASGKPMGPGYALKTSAAPAAAPVAFGPDRAFVSLTDGTGLLLELRRLRDPLAALPTIGP